jgi:hypothetical protein
MGRPGGGKGFRAWAGRSSPLLRGSLLLVLTVSVTMLPLVGGDHAASLALRTFAIVVLAFLPGAMFLRFVTGRAQSVLDEYVLNLHRLGIDLPQHLPKPPVNSIYHQQWVDAGGPALTGERNIYRAKFDAYYGKSTGPEQRDGGYHVKVETFFPVLLATAVFAAGWTAVLSGRPSLTLLPLRTGSLSTADLLRVGFVGAYLFTLQMLVRRYFQADLKASAYINAVTRVVSALVVVPVVSVGLLSGASADTRLVVAFVIGFFPLVGLQALQKVAALTLRTVVPSLRNDYPLSDLDGLSVWYEARLLELGIEDMENLATANLVDVTLHSRVPVSRLVDWVDQAHLYLHLEPKSGDDSSRRILRRLGVRTATALEDAVRPCPAGADTVARGLVPADTNRELLADLRCALNRDGLTPSVTTSLLKTFENDPNLKHVRHWKRDWTQVDPQDATPVPATVPLAPSVVPATNGVATNGHTATVAGDRAAATNGVVAHAGAAR